jgi:N-acetylglucosamine-6-phosphate deacetylase
MELIADIVDSGAIAAVGHTDADYDEARAAFAAGASLVTHLCNGMTPLHHRAPGVVGAALQMQIAAELINDGVHVHPAVVELIARAGAPIALVTDAIAAAGMPDGPFALGGQDVEVRHGEARLVRGGSLAGSTLTMDVAFRRAVVDSGWPITRASRAASGVPAAVLGMADRCGAIAAGLAADLVVLDDHLRTARVMAAGQWCEPAPVQEDDR